MRQAFSLIALLIAASSFSQIVNIPDANFKSKLLSASPTTQVATQAGSEFVTIDTNGNGEIEVSEAVMIEKLYVNNSSIASLEGIEAFTNLRMFECRLNQITALDLSALTLLSDLDCSRNLLTEFNFTGMDSLLRFNCNVNPITAFDFSQAPQLWVISASSNLLTTVDITVCPSLKQVSFHDNNLTSIQCSQLPELLFLTLSSNALQTVNLEGSNSLLNLNLSANQIFGLDISNLPSLKDLAVRQNNSIDLSLINSTLEKLDVSYSWQVDLDVSQLPALKELVAEYNQIEIIDVSSNPLVYKVHARNNPLQQLNIKNGRNSTSLNFQNCPSLLYVCADPIEISLVNTLISSYNYSNCHANPYCNFFPGGNIFQIYGNVRHTSDASLCNVGESYPNLKLSISDGTTSDLLIANSTGSYSIFKNAGNYTLTPVAPDYYTISPQVSNFSLLSQPAPQMQDFCLTPIGEHTDVEITLLPLNPARPGSNASYKIVYRNIGTTSVSGSVTMHFSDSHMNFLSAVPAPDSQITDYLTWDYQNLTPFEERIIYVQFLLNSPTDNLPVNSGMDLGFDVIITPYETDENYYNNISELKQLVVNSLDPNSKTCIQGNSIDSSDVGKFVDYIIHFENLGTAPAENVVIKDVIDLSKFDISTLIPVTGSHLFETRILAGNQVEFVFENIQLPFNDENNDGHVAFKIKTLPSLQVGDLFSNSAAIYFDYNFPIITNTATTTITALATNDFHQKDSVTLYPNPAKNSLNIKTDSTMEKSISIYNMLGQLLLTEATGEGIIELNVAHLQSGTYLIRVNSNAENWSGMFVKE